jgi:DNA-directed RNA polymerase subunit RPC12/RpoP
MVRYACPRCNKSLESPASFAGQKLNCPDCNQRLQVPQPSAPPPPPVNKTILAVEQPPTVPPARGSPASRQPAPAAASRPAAKESDVVEVVGQTSSGRRENCLECGVDVTGQSRVQTCPDCGSVFCSARCYREHNYYAHAPRGKPRQRTAQCPFCNSTARPYISSAVSQAGWVTFALLLVFCFPLFWIGLLITEPQVHCADCGARLS